MADESHFGRWLRDTINSLGVSNRKFAAQALVSESSLKMWLKSQCPPIRPFNLARIARRIGITFEAIKGILENARVARIEGDAAGAAA